MSERLTIALIGSGHLGGSFALALHEAGAEVSVRAYDADPTQAELLKQRGGAETVCATLADAVRGADIVMLATPLRSYRGLAQTLAPLLADHTIVTDLGSVKHSMTDLAGLLPSARLVPGHPIAGGEKTGAAEARGDLFRDRICILTPNDDVEESAIGAVENLWHLTGADVLRMPTEVHDAIYAYVSHLPHLIAFIAAEALYQEGALVPADDETLQRFLRISRSNPRMWTDIFLENRESLLPALATYIAILEHFSVELSSGKNESATLPENTTTRFVPRILASSLISAVSLYEQQSGMSLRPFGAGGMRDIVAPAAVDPESELAAISDAAPWVAASLRKLVPYLRTIERQVGAEDEPSLYRTLSDMVSHAHALAKPRQ